MAKAKRRRPMAEINVVPYIDVMLVLLVIFMVATPLMTQGIVVDLPAANSGPVSVEDDDPTLVVSVKELASVGRPPRGKPAIIRDPVGDPCRTIRTVATHIDLVGP